MQADAFIDPLRLVVPLVTSKALRQSLNEGALANWYVLRELPSPLQDYFGYFQFDAFEARLRCYLTVHDGYITRRAGLYGMNHDIGSAKHGMINLFMPFIWVKGSNLEHLCLEPG